MKSYGRRRWTNTRREPWMPWAVPGPMEFSVGGDPRKIRISEVPFKLTKALWRDARMRTHLVLGLRETTIRGVRLHTGERYCPPRVRQNLIRGSYENAEAALLAKALRPGDRVLDIGAGIGFTSILATQRVKHGQVLSYEANPKLGSTIEENFRLNGLSPRLRAKAVSKSGGRMTLYSNRDVISTSAMIAKAGSVPITVDSDAINDVIFEFEPDVLVLDVEGAEAELIEAARLDGINLVLVEVHPTILSLYSIAKSFQELAKAGLYRCRSIGNNHLFCR